MSVRPRATTDEIDLDKMHTGLRETLAFLPIDCESRLPLVDRREDCNIRHQAVMSRIAELHSDDLYINGLEDREGERGRRAERLGRALPLRATRSVCVARLARPTPTLTLLANSHKHSVRTMLGHNRIHWRYKNLRC